MSSFYDIGAKGIGRVFIKNTKGEQVFRVDFSGSSRPEPIQEPGSTLTSASLPVLAIENMPAWHTVLVPLKDVVVPEPQTLSVYYEENSIEQSLGFFVLGLLEVPMPTPERIAALKSDPRANKVAMIRLGCKTCDSHLSIYAAIEKKGDPPKDAIWYQDLGEIFECTCGSTRFPLKYIRQNMHGLLVDQTFPFGSVHLQLCMNSKHCSKHIRHSDVDRKELYRRGTSAISGHKYGTFPSVVSRAYLHEALNSDKV